MKTIQINAYQFHELSDQAKDKIINNLFRESFTQQDFWDTCLAINDIFPVNIFRIDSSAWRIEYQKEDIDEPKTKSEYIADCKYKADNSYALTGAYCDAYFLDALPNEWAITQEHLYNAIEALAKGAEEEYEQEFSYLVIWETCEANEYLFTINGELIK